MFSISLYNHNLIYLCAWPAATAMPCFEAAPLFEAVPFFERLPPMAVLARRAPPSPRTGVAASAGTPVLITVY